MAQKQTIEERRSIVRAAARLQASYAETAQFYLNYAKNYPVGSLGYVGNMAESAKYARMASGSVNER